MCFHLHCAARHWSPTRFHSERRNDGAHGPKIVDRGARQIQGQGKRWRLLCERRLQNTNLASWRWTCWPPPLRLLLRLTALESSPLWEQPSQASPLLFASVSFFRVASLPLGAGDPVPDIILTVSLAQCPPSQEPLSFSSSSLNPFQTKTGVQDSKNWSTLFSFPVWETALTPPNRYGFDNTRFPLSFLSGMQPEQCL